MLSKCTSRKKKLWPIAEILRACSASPQDPESQRRACAIPSTSRAGFQKRGYVLNIVIPYSVPCRRRGCTGARPTTRCRCRSARAARTSLSPCSSRSGGSTAKTWPRRRAGPCARAACRSSQRSLRLYGSGTCAPLIIDGQSRPGIHRTVQNFLSIFNSARLSNHASDVTVPPLTPCSATAAQNIAVSKPLSVWRLCAYCVLGLNCAANSTIYRHCVCTTYHISTANSLQGLAVLKQPAIGLVCATSSEHRVNY